MNELDLSIFKEIENNECDKSHHSKCRMMNRLTLSLRYYGALNIIQNEDHREIFRNFMMEIYCTLIDDYIHFKDIHSNDLEEIYADLIENKIFNECNINECTFTSRHYSKRERNEYEEKENDLFDPYLHFYKETMDSIHFYLFHCFDVGLRVKKEINDDTLHEFDDKKEDKYFDAAFDRINKGIKEREYITSAFDRFSVENTKYSIATQLNEVKEDDIMYCDRLFMHLMRVKVHDIEIKTLSVFLKHNEYDTDSIEFDHNFKQNANITQHIETKQCLNEYDQFITAAKVSASSFSVGVRYYYWDYYKKNIKDMDADHQHLMPMLDHSGSNHTELFVAAKYESFKEELCHYKFISLKYYKDEILVKVKMYLNSQIVKKTTATFMGTDSLHYGINWNDALSFDHLLALTLYTDCSDLCTDFSSTFRRVKAFESLSSMMKRNSEYCFMSKHLRECVEIYGQSRYGDRRYIKEKVSYLSGPFYCGVNVVLNMDSFSLRLCAPTSTSKQIEVGMKFSGNHGMVLQLNNPNTAVHEQLCGFNASWISKYTEEDERLFIGGLWAIEIQSVRIKATKQNFEEFIYCLYWLDSMLNAGGSDGIDMNKCDVSTIKHLLNTALSFNISTEKRFDDYIYATFAAFVQNKTKLTLDAYGLYGFDDKLRDLLMNKMGKREHKEEEQRKDSDLTNLPKSKMFEIFKNIKSVIIYSTDGSGRHSFSLSMMSLLSLIESGGLTEVRVQAASNIDDGSNWINDLWSSSETILKQEYKNKKYTIDKKYTIVLCSSSSSSYTIGKDFYDDYDEYHEFVINKII